MSILDRKEALDPGLFDWLKFTVQIIEPLSNISLIRLERIVPRWEIIGHMAPK